MKNKYKNDPDVVKVQEEMDWTDVCRRLAMGDTVKMIEMLNDGSHVMIKALDLLKILNDVKDRIEDRCPTCDPCTIDEEMVKQIERTLTFGPIFQQRAIEAIEPHMDGWREMAEDAEEDVMADAKRSRHPYAACSIPSNAEVMCECGGWSHADGSSKHKPDCEHGS